MFKKDRVFAKKLKSIKAFEFNENVANVFEDMLNRSIPFYNEIHSLSCDLLSKTIEDGDLIYDLGCSTATTIKLLDKSLLKKEIKAHFIGVDNSKAMIEKAEKKLKRTSTSKRTKLICSNIENLKFEKSKAIIMNYTLQFISKDKRPQLLSSIYKSLKKHGVYILAEKINTKDSEIDFMLTELYYDFKRRNGYSNLEISQKREALENVLEPLTPEQNLDLLKKAGFIHSEMVFRWYNFACFIGIK